MTARFIHEGKRIDYTPTADVVAGTPVVLNDLVGVVDLDIVADQLGALAIEGVYEITKVTGVGTGATIGAKWYYDETGEQATQDDDSGNNKYIGKNTVDAGDDDAEVDVKLGQ